MIGLSGDVLEIGNRVISYDRLLVCGILLGWSQLIFSEEVVDVSNKMFAGMVGGVITICSVAVLAESKYSFYHSRFAVFCFFQLCTQRKLPLCKWKHLVSQKMTRSVHRIAPNTY